jgi:flagellar biosynthesis/type III secretory pathway chaperone
MDELLNLLKTLRACIVAIDGAYSQLVEIMETEEDLISRYEMGPVQNVIVEKDQVVQRIQKLEEKRNASMKRICFLISYDARRNLPSLSEFTLVFDSYLSNIEKLIAAEIHVELFNLFVQCKEASHSLKHNFSSRYEPRIYRNKTIVAKCLRNFQRSIKIFEDASGSAGLYDPKGNTRSDRNHKEATSILRVQA